MKKTLKIKRLSASAILPTKGTAQSAGIDLYANTDDEITIRPGRTVLVGSGIAAEIPSGYFGMVVIRSGISLKRGITMVNGVGIIDSDYRGEIGLTLHNSSEITQYIAPHERVAQMILIPYADAEVAESDTLDETERGTGGFGSTGTK